MSCCSSIINKSKKKVSMKNLWFSNHTLEIDQIEEKQKQFFLKTSNHKRHDLDIEIPFLNKIQTCK